MAFGSATSAGPASGLAIARQPGFRSADACAAQPREGGGLQATVMTENLDGQSGVRDDTGSEPESDGAVPLSSALSSRRGIDPGRRSGAQPLRQRRSGRGSAAHSSGRSHGALNSGRTSITEELRPQRLGSGRKLVGRGRSGPVASQHPTAAISSLPAAAFGVRLLADRSQPQFSSATSSKTTKVDSSGLFRTAASARSRP